MYKILNQIYLNQRKIFYILDDNVITYQQALHGIYNFINWFSSRKIVNQSIILNLDHSVSSQLFFLAALHTNNILLMPPGHTPSVLNYLQENRFKNTISLTDCPKLDLTPCVPNVDIQPGSCCLLSSGTTGLPKIVELKYDELVHYGQGLKHFFDITESDRFYNLVPFYHGFGLTRLFSIIFSGSSQTLPSSSNIENTWNEINRNHCTWASFVPRLISVLNRRPGQLWKGFRFATSSASLINVYNQKLFETQVQKPLFVEYGCTEIGIISSNNFDSQVYGSLGRPSGPVQIRNGTLWVQPSWKNNNQWIDTGDIVEIKDHNLWLLGRNKEIIKKNGRTIFPFEIEQEVLKVDGVEEAVVYARDAHTDNESIGLIYTGTVSIDELRHQCTKIFDPALRPHHICHSPAIPYHNNKIKRQDLQKYADSLQ